MKQLVVGTFEAKTKLSEFLDRIQSGREEIVITRRGKKIAKLVPYEDLNEKSKAATQASQLLSQIKAELKSQGVYVSTADLCSLVREGRKY
ncbi:type II toxin-antitoxin system prevent-host-death family antitoxin [bacterium]|nr:type II toxin-antitoxin system prevent-host-death family antitoxin [bacterium]